MAPGTAGVRAKQHVVLFDVAVPDDAHVQRASLCHASEDGRPIECVPHRPAFDGRYLIGAAQTGSVGRTSRLDPLDRARWGRGDELSAELFEREEITECRNDEMARKRRDRKPHANAIQTNSRGAHQGSQKTTSLRETLAPNAWQPVLATLRASQVCQGSSAGL